MVNVYACAFGEEERNEDMRSIATILRLRLLVGEGVTNVPPPAIELLTANFDRRKWAELSGLICHLGWKASEVGGKLVGCQFWSAAAYYRIKNAWEGVSHGRDAQGKQFAEFAQFLGRKDWGGIGIEHEHVHRLEDLPGLVQQTWVRLRNGDEWQQIGELKRLLIRCAVGCVVTREEHQRVHRIPSQEENPWLRYAQPNTPILLHPRDQWPEPHDELIRGAGIVARQQR